MECLHDGPGPGQRVIDRGDFVAQEILIRLVERDTLLDDRLVVMVERDAACLVYARTFQAAGLDFEGVKAAVAVGIKPLADRVVLAKWAPRP